MSSRPLASLLQYADCTFETQSAMRKIRRRDLQQENHRESCAPTAMNASDVEFDESVVPELLGWPSRITGEDFLELETSFVQAYNDLVNCTQTGAVRFIDNASVSS